MSLVLSVRTGAWSDHVQTTVDAYGGPDRIVPVMKGNGYGLGRLTLLERYRALVDPDLDGPFGVAVGTVHEAACDLSETVSDLDESPVRRHVLTPVMGPLSEGLDPSCVLTVGDPHHVAHLARLGWEGPVVIKLASSMRRYGVDPGELRALVRGVEAARCEIVGVAIHLPLAGDDGARSDEILTWLRHLDVHWPVSVSHLAAATFTRLVETHGERSWWIRLGTSMWHGDKSMLHLGATVVQSRRVRRGDALGYRGVSSPVDGHVLAVGAGSAQGLRVLPDGASPLHFARRRLALVENPHMHTTLAVVPEGDPVPEPGELVDVQCPLTQVTPDEVVWLGQWDRRERQ